MLDLVAVFIAQSVSTCKLFISCNNLTLALVHLVLYFMQTNDLIGM
jgi:hypothetical protein